MTCEESLETGIWCSADMLVKQRQELVANLDILCSRANHEGVLQSDRQLSPSDAFVLVDLENKIQETFELRRHFGSAFKEQHFGDDSNLLLQRWNAITVEDPSFGKIEDFHAYSFIARSLYQRSQCTEEWSSLLAKSLNTILENVDKLQNESGLNCCFVGRTCHWIHWTFWSSRLWCLWRG